MRRELMLILVIRMCRAVCGCLGRIRVRMIRVVNGQPFPMNLSEFNKTHEGNKCDRTFDKTMLTGLTFFVWAGGVEGKDCNPVIMIDNIRVVPIE